MTMSSTTTSIPTSQAHPSAPLAAPNPSAAAAGAATIRDAFARLKRSEPRVRRSTAEERIAKLVRLRQAILERAPEIREAMHKDYRKSPHEVDLLEIFPTLGEINHTIKYLKKWMRPVRARSSLSVFGTASELRYEPKGTALVIAPWNYPFQLLVCPLVAAVSAGCCVMLKPSELTAHTSAFLKDFIARIFDPSEVCLIEGDAQATQEMLALPFDHVFFTGSTRVGRIVMEAAAKNLASVTLELGGKSPAIFDETADYAKAAETLAWGKFINGGQTCVAPDYALVPEAKLDAFVEGMRARIERFYGENEEKRAASPDFCRVINDRNYQRLKTLLEQTVAQGAKVAIGGRCDDRERYIAPTVLTGVRADSPIMADEIFGPILPVLTYRTLDEAIEGVRGRDKPLALYVFSEDRSRVERILGETTAGGTCVNNAVVQLVNPNLPFGGVGPSGLGNYHGFFGFKAFSHERAVMRQGRFNAFRMLYPPYTPRVQQLIRLAVRFLTR